MACSCLLFICSPTTVGATTGEQAPYHAQAVIKSDILLLMDSEMVEDVEEMTIIGLLPQDTANNPHMQQAVVGEEEAEEGVTMATRQTIMAEDTVGELMMEGDTCRITDIRSGLHPLTMLPTRTGSHRTRSNRHLLTMVLWDIHCPSW